MLPLVNNKIYVNFDTCSNGGTVNRLVNFASALTYQPTMAAVPNLFLFAFPQAEIENLFNPWLVLSLSKLAPRLFSKRHLIEATSFRTFLANLI